MKYLNTYESFSKNYKNYSGESFIYDILYWDEILDLYEKLYPDQKLEDEEDLWNKVNKNEFLEDFFEYDTFIEDEWKDLFNDEDDKPLLMSYIKKRIKNNLDLYNLKDKLQAYKTEDLKDVNIDEILQMFNNEELKEIITDISTSYDFSCSLVNKYKNGYGVYDMLKDFYSEDELDIDFFKENRHEILQSLYLDEDSYYDEMMNKLLRMPKELQELLFSKNPGLTAQFLIQKYQTIIKPLAETYKFQKAFIEELITENPYEIWQEMQIFLKKKVEIHHQIMKEYDLDVFKEAEKFNF